MHQLTPIQDEVEAMKLKVDAANARVEESDRVLASNKQIIEYLNRKVATVRARTMV